VIRRYSIEFRRSAEKELGKLDAPIRARILRTITALGDAHATRTALTSTGGAELNGKPVLAHLRSRNGQVGDLDFLINLWRCLSLTRTP